MQQDTWIKTVTFKDMEKSEEDKLLQEMEEVKKIKKQAEEKERKIAKEIFRLEEKRSSKRRNG
jgi:hypothetical protein